MKLDLSDSKKVTDRMETDHEFAHQVFRHYRDANEVRISALPLEDQPAARATYNAAMTAMHTSWSRQVGRNSRRHRAKYGSLEADPMDQDTCHEHNHWLLKEPSPLEEINRLHLEQEKQLANSYLDAVKSN